MPRPVSGDSHGPLLLGAGLVVLVGGGIALAVVLRRNQDALAPAAPQPSLPAMPPAPPPITAAPMPSPHPSPSPPSTPQPSASRPKNASISDLSPAEIRSIGASAQIPAQTTPQADASTPVRPLVRTLKQGMSGEDVRGIQQLLRALGQNIDADGQFGPQTTAAVKAVQKQAGVSPVDGVVGEQTRKGMQALYAKTILNSGAKPL